MSNVWGHYAALLLLLWVAANALVLIVYRRALWRLWREPVLRRPVLVTESDDWGAGPLSQVAALRAIADVLLRHRDGAGRAPTFNLALVLAVPDGPALQAGAGYRRVCLDAPVFAPILSALHDGQASGVFALQLHGLEHYWPQTLMSCDDSQVQAWLRQLEPATTEHLPSHLQSRWVDTARLPSTPHANAAVRAAVAEEIESYGRILGLPPRIVVPPTFVWTRDTERAWADQGIECIVTPGRRYTARDAHGQPGGADTVVVNGDGVGKLLYLVRTDYFEPVRGRDAAHALRALELAVTMGRPCLLENHRDNFIGEPQTCRHSLAELDKLYGGALARHADLRFLTTAELGQLLRGRDPQWLATGFAERLPFVWVRLRHAGRLWKLMTLTGAAAVATWMVRLLGAPVTRPRASNS